MTRTFRTLTYDRVSHTKLDRERRMISARLTDSSSLCRDHAHDTLHRPAATATASRTPCLRTGSVSTWKHSRTPLALRAVLPTCAHLRAAVRPTNADDATAQRNDATQRRNAPAQPRCNARHHSATAHWVERPSGEPEHASKGTPRALIDVNARRQRAPRSATAPNGHTPAVTPRPRRAPTRPRGTCRGRCVRSTGRSSAPDAARAAPLRRRRGSAP